MCEEKIYIDFEFYKMHGGKLDYLGFAKNAFKASRIIDLHTHNRLKDKDIPISVMFACVELIEHLNAHPDTAVKSFSTDGYSETLGGIADVKSAEIDILLSYLGEEYIDGVPLLYMGVDC